MRRWDLWPWRPWLLACLLWLWQLAASLTSSPTLASQVCLAAAPALSPAHVLTIARVMAALAFLEACGSLGVVT